MDKLVDEIIELILIEPVSLEEMQQLTRLVSELLCSRKNWLVCLKENIVTPSEVAAGILGHISTFDNGRFSQNSFINFNKETELANLLVSST